MIHAGYEGSHHFKKKIHNPLRVIYFFCNVETFIFGMDHQRKHLIV